MGHVPQPLAVQGADVADVNGDHVPAVAQVLQVCVVGHVAPHHRIEVDFVRAHREHTNHHRPHHLGVRVAQVQGIHGVVVDTAVGHNQLFQTAQIAQGFLRFFHGDRDAGDIDLGGICGEGLPGKAQVEQEEGLRLQIRQGPAFGLGQAGILQVHFLKFGQQGQGLLQLLCLHRDAGQIQNFGVIGIAGFPDGNGIVQGQAGVVLLQRQQEVRRGKRPFQRQLPQQGQQGQGLLQLCRVSICHGQGRGIRRAGDGSDCNAWSRCLRSRNRRDFACARAGGQKQHAQQRCGTAASPEKKCTVHDLHNLLSILQKEIHQKISGSTASGGCSRRTGPQLLPQ